MRTIFNLFKRSPQDVGGSTANQDLPVRRYTVEFRDMLQTVFGAQAFFGDFFAGGLEALEGIQNNDEAFRVKTSDIPVVVGVYNTDSDVAFGTGTGNSSRFGPRTEIIYVDTPVPYTHVWAFDEGIDNFTVNNLPAAAVADRLELQARAKTNLFNTWHGAFIANSAGNTQALANYSPESVLELFNMLAAYYVNIQAMGTKVAKVVPALYNALVDHPLTVVEKRGEANISSNTIVRFKDFIIEAIPDQVLTVSGTQYAAYTYITGIGKAFTGINTVRTIMPEGFDGVALQGAGKAGEFMIDDNKKAVVRVTAPVAAPAP